MSDAVSNNIPSKTVQIYFFLTISSWQQSCSFSQLFHNFTKHILQVALVDAYVSTCCGVAVFHKISSQALHCYLFQPVLLQNLMVHDAALAGFLGSVCIAKLKRGAGGREMR